MNRACAYLLGRGVVGVDRSCRRSRRRARLVLLPDPIMRCAIVAYGKPGPRADHLRRVEALASGRRRPVGSPRRRRGPSRRFLTRPRTPLAFFREVNVHDLFEMMTWLAPHSRRIQKPSHSTVISRAGPRPERRSPWASSNWWRRADRRRIRSALPTLSRRRYPRRDGAPRLDHRRDAAKPAKIFARAALRFAQLDPLRGPPILSRPRETGCIAVQGR